MAKPSECKVCKVKKCPPKCFDNHPGSIIALLKCFGDKVVVIDEEGGVHKKK